MKRPIRLFILMLVLLLPVQSVLAAVGDILSCGDYLYYLLEDGSACIARYIGADAQLTIPETLDGHPVTAIGMRAFFYNMDVETLVLPPCVTRVDAQAFRGSNLRSVTILGDTAIGEGAFEYCAALTDVFFQNSAATIGRGAFNRCESLPSVILPSGLTTLEDYAFCDCTHLIAIALPDGVTTIGTSAFDGCVNMVAVQLPASLTRIDEKAFRGCVSLESITLPPSLREIGELAFSNCALIHIELPNGLTIIGDSAFYWCTKLKSAVVPPSVTSIGRDIFNSCGALELVVSVVRDSVADTHCRENRIPRDYLDPDAF